MKREWLEKEVGVNILSGAGDDEYAFLYRAMHDNGMSMGDADRYAWINTLIGYDVGAEKALAIIRHYDEQGMDVIEANADSLREQKLDLDYSRCVKETPGVIRYDW